jgi:hypothetical protein
MKPAAAFTALCLVATPASACQSDSVRIAAEILAQAINSACQCERGTMLLDTPVIMRHPIIKGEAGRYLDNQYVQSRLTIFREVERAHRC